MKNFIPLARPSLPDFNDIKPMLKDVLKSGMITEHKFVNLFEKKCAEFLKVKYALATSSGTSALILALKCLELKGEIIIPSFTYTSDAHALLWCGLKPVFSDIDPETFTLDAETAEKKISSKTAAIMPTHVFGNPCDISAFENIRRKKRLKVIYDAAHAFGSTYRGKSMSAFGDITIYSLTPTKVLTTGEGGLITTNNKALAEKLRLAKFNGDSFDRNKEFLGMTSRMSEFQAIIGLANLERLPADFKKRAVLVNYYKKKLSGIKGITFQKIDEKATSVYKDLTIVVEAKKSGFSRERLYDEFKKNNIQTKVYFYPTLNKKKVYKKFANLKLPVTDYIAARIINLPLYNQMKKSDIDRVCRIIIKLPTPKK